MPYYTLIIILLFSACAPSSREQYRSEGIRLSAQLADTLKQISTRDELLAKSKKIKKQIDSLIDLSISAYDFEKRHPRDTLKEKTFFQSDQLEYEIRRICQIDGCSAIFSQLQRGALEKLYLEVNPQISG